MGEKRQQRILVITDDPETGALVQAILAGGGFAVGLVTNREVTIEQIEAGSPGLVVVDTLTPLLEQWSILGPLVQLPHPPPIVLLSGRCMSPLVLAALSQAVSGHLSKPFAAKALVEKCERLLAGPNRQAPPGGQERRAEPRHRFLGQATLLTAGGDPLVTAEVFDLGPGGTQIDLGPVPAGQFKPGHPVRLALILPPSFESIPLMGRIEWRRGQTMGVSFTELTTDARRQFQERLAKAFPRRDSPRKGRG